MTEERWKETTDWVKYLQKIKDPDYLVKELYDYCVSLRGELEESFKRDAVHGLHASNINRKLNETLTDLAQARGEVEKLKDSVLCEHQAAIDMFCKYDELKSELAQARGEIEKLKSIKCSHGDYEMYGTDGCETCNTGRIEMYRLSKSCIQCIHKGEK